MIYLCWQTHIAGSKRDYSMSKFAGNIEDTTPWVLSFLTTSSAKTVTTYFVLQNAPNVDSS
jgi:hypothetical protein